MLLKNLWCRWKSLRGCVAAAAVSGLLLLAACDEDSGTSASSENRFNSEIVYGSMIDSRDGQIYKTVKIGNQVWMAENLNYADSTKTPSLLKRSWCYNYKDENCAVFGRLYTWAAAIDSVKLVTDVDNSQDCGYGKTCTLPVKV